MAESADDAEPGTTVLIVDDEQNVADLYGTWVEMSTGYGVEVVYDGPAAVAAVTGEGESEGKGDGGGESDDDGDTEPDDDPTAAVDAVLLDRRMPGMSGDEVLEELRDQGYDVPVAMVTAVKLEDAPLEASYHEYLTKPIMREDIERVIPRLLEYDPDADDGETADDEDAAADSEAEPSAPDPGAEPEESSSGEVSDEVRETLNDVTQKLDEIQQTVDADDETEDEQGDDPETDLVTGEDIRRQIGGATESGSESTGEDDG